MRLSGLSALVVASLVGALGCAGANDGDDAESTESELGGSSKVSIRFAAFIPCDALSSPEPRFSHYYAGDNRGFSYDLATTRSRAAFDGYLDTKASMYAFTPFVGETKAYNKSEIDGQSGQCYSLVDSPSVARRGTADISRMTTTAVRLSPTQTKVTLAMHAKNPIAWFSPYLDADLSVTIDNDAKGMPVAFSVEGTHDHFPAYELYVNGKTVYTFDGIAQGYDAFDLGEESSTRARVAIARRPL